MAKTLFDVLLSVTGRHYDFWIPDDMTMRDAATLAAEAVQVTEPAFYRKIPDAALMYVPTGEIQNSAATVAEIGFTDADRFVLV